MNSLQRNSDNTFSIVESFDIAPLGTEDEISVIHNSVTEAEKTSKNKKLVVKIFAMPESITRNKTFYPLEELQKSVDTWTSPYQCPVIKDHDEWSVDNIVGRINKAYIASDVSNKGLWFEASILDSSAQEKISSGLWQQVSIGTRVSSAVCSICGNDWTKSDCSHRRGQYYLTNPEDPASVAECYWIMRGISGKEVSFVVTPSAAAAGVRKKSESEQESEDIIYMTNSSELIDLTEEEMIEFTESYIKTVSSLGSPASDGVAVVPSSKEEEGMNVENIDTHESELSDVTPEGEEAPESEDPKTEDQVDGLSVEGDKDESDSQSEESDPTDSEEATSMDEDDSTSMESGNEAEVREEESDPLIVSLRQEVEEYKSQIKLLKTQLYVESGLRDGVLAGELDALVESHAQMSESALDELIEIMGKRRGHEVSLSEQLMQSRIESPLNRITDDDNADNKTGKKKDESVSTVKLKVGEGFKSFSFQEESDRILIKPIINKKKARR